MAGYYFLCAILFSAMKVRVFDIKESGIHIETFKNPEWLEDAAELYSGDKSTRLTSRIDIDIQLNKVLREVIVSGSALFSIEAPCSRCLKTVKLELKPEINLLLTPVEMINEEDNDINHETYTGDEVDISDYIREQVAMSLPYKIVCSESCMGLCPICGVDLNDEQCTCASDRVDPRFVVLKNLKI